MHSVTEFHLLADQRLHSVIGLAAGSAAPTTAEYESARCDRKRLDAVEQSHRGTAQGDRPRDTGFHVVGWHVPLVAVDLAPRRAHDLTGSGAAAEQ